MRLIHAFRSIPERNKIIVYGRLNMIKGLFYFIFKIVVGIVFNSSLLIAMALYNLCIDLVKVNCSRGLKKNTDDLKDCNSYITGGIVIAVSSICYASYAVIQLFNPSNTKYHMIVGIIIALFATYSIVMSIIGVVKTRGKTMLIKEYRLANFAGAFTNIVLAQIAILSFTTEANMASYNALVSGIVGVFIFAIGIYLIVHGILMKRVYTTGITNAK